MFFFSFQFIDTAVTNCSKFSLVVLLAYLLHRTSCFANFEGILGFSVLSIISVGVGLMQVTMHPAWTAKTKQRMVKEIVIVTRIFVKRRRKTLLYSRK